MSHRDFGNFYNVFFPGGDDALDTIPPDRRFPTETFNLPGFDFDDFVQDDSGGGFTIDDFLRILLNFPSDDGEFFPNKGGIPDFGDLPDLGGGGPDGTGQETDPGGGAGQLGNPPNPLEELLRALGLGDNETLGRILGGIRGGVNLFDEISKLFRTDETGVADERAAALQQNIETAARGILSEFEAGRLDHDAALKALQQLQFFVASIAREGGDDSLTRAGQMANLIITEVTSKIQADRNTSLQRPFSTPNANRLGLDGQPPSGSPAFQSSRLRSGLRDFLIGTEGGIGDSLRSEGGPFGESPSFAELITRNNSTQNPERLNQFTAQVEGLFPAPREDEFSGFRSRLRNLQDERIV